MWNIWLLAGLNLLFVCGAMLFGYMYVWRDETAKGFGAPLIVFFAALLLYGVISQTACADLGAPSFPVETIEQYQCQLNGLLLQIFLAANMFGFAMTEISLLWIYWWKQQVMD